MSLLQSFRRQNLLVEFASLKQTSPDGFYLSLTPGDPTVWSGILFIRKGPYAPAILRFEIAFPPNYPDAAPLVTFNTDMFHPLLVSLTTYTYSAGTADSDTVSATDEERLPPGGFGLRHGFPHWFAKRTSSTTTSAKTSRNVSGSSFSVGPPEDGTSTAGESRKDSDSSARATPPGSNPSSPRGLPSVKSISERMPRKDISIVEILQYIRSSFDDIAVLDSIPFEAAGNPNAWHAWRTYRGHVSPKQRGSGARRPGEWNWEGVWEMRAKAGIEASVSDAVLYGNAAQGDNMIRFKNMDQELIDQARQSLKKGVGAGSVA
ncbi:MAG: hypothetical protein M1834_007135 [Cirrosporium novae-zelandiae]|nr:MAG: hypothetical protein M1834_007135 [Cirrosporium novae-zelandiae]